MCSQICENGGNCVGPDTCSCAPNWSGYDCATPTCPSDCDAYLTLCVGPDTCVCIPGYVGSDCQIPTCTQTCGNGSRCIAPDTCSCTYGWFDANCAIPVCSQTCRSGGNYNLPSTCSCPSEWTGTDCLILLCTQTCRNGAHCIALNTCLCTSGWSVHDYSIPICDQGFLVADPSTYMYASDRTWTWDSYQPSEPSEWCSATNEFDLSQPARKCQRLDVAWGPSARAQNGHKVQPEVCTMFELNTAAIMNFQYFSKQNKTSAYFRFASTLGYGFNASGWP